MIVPTILLTMKFTDVTVMAANGIRTITDRTATLNRHSIIRPLVSEVLKQWMVASVVRGVELRCVPLCSRVAMTMVGRKLTRKFVSGLNRVVAEVLLVNIGSLVVLVVRHSVIVSFVRC